MQNLGELMKKREVVFNLIFILVISIVLLLSVLPVSYAAEDTVLPDDNAAANTLNEEKTNALSDIAMPTLFAEKDKYNVDIILRDLTTNKPIKNMFVKYSLDGISSTIYVDTTAGLPENTRYVKEVCEYLNINLKIVRPKVDYFTLAKKWGIPSFKYRWCCRELKIKPIDEFLDTIKGPKVVFDGIRAAESNIRRKYIPIWYHPSFKCLSVSPIFYWSDKQVISYVNSNGIPKTILNSSGTSTECWCGAYKTKSDFENLFNLDREMFYKLVEVEEENKCRYTFIYENGQKISLQELAKNLKK